MNNLVYYRLLKSKDPEQLSENAILYKCLKDLYKDRLVPLFWEEKPNTQSPIFGQDITNSFVSSSSAKFKYWEDHAFLQTVKRSFRTLTFDDAEKEIKRLHSLGIDAFVKATATKRLVAKVPIGKTLVDILGSDCYEFCDIPEPCLMVQEFVEFEHEMRFFFINKGLVTKAHCVPHLTPLYRAEYFTHHFKRYNICLIPMAEKLKELANQLQYQDAIIDVGLTNIRGNEFPDWDVIEINPLIPGQVGLYDCDVLALADAIHYSKLEERLHLYK